MQVAIVKYNAGNSTSVAHALRRLGIEPVLTDDADTLRNADKIIFPGQGEAASAMRYLRQRGLDTLLAGLTQPFLGICLGLQLMCTHTEEGDTPCLNLVPVQVRRFPPGDKVPHMGWNTLDSVSGPLFEGIPAGTYFYFVHSYYAERNAAHTTAQCTYQVPFSAALHRDNFHAVQFHPEKSSEAGERLLHNFLRL
ncbi:MAG: imidazole glycerol phosphate synthase subunit HisH [Bacteroidetes bacterium]|nr:imidazole glycerol phosphate synthase subunit HisH [Bacteroidota bacterium]